MEQLRQITHPGNTILADVENRGRGIYIKRKLRKFKENSFGKAEIIFEKLEPCPGTEQEPVPIMMAEGGRGVGGGGYGDSRLSPTPQHLTSPCEKTKTDLINSKENPEAENNLMNSIEAYLKEDYRQENMVTIPQRINLQQNEELLFIRSDDYGIITCQEM